MKLKRLFDLCITIPGLLMVMPILFLAGIWVRLDSPGPVLFSQVRVGRHGRLFNILKFRTMRMDTQGSGLKITPEHDPRITASGRFLRQYKLDELPQLFNILKGEMSLVGPRPEVPEYVALYPEAVKRLVLSVPPGITDYASIEYRHESVLLSRADDPHTDYVEHILPAKLALNKKYVETRSIRTDFFLIAKTVLTIFN